MFPSKAMQLFIFSSKIFLTKNGRGRFFNMGTISINPFCYLKIEGAFLLDTPFVPIGYHWDSPPFEQTTGHTATQLSVLISMEPTVAPPRPPPVISNKNVRWDYLKIFWIFFHRQVFFKSAVNENSIWLSETVMQEKITQILQGGSKSSLKETRKNAFNRWNKASNELCYLSSHELYISSMCLPSLYNCYVFGRFFGPIEALEFQHRSTWRLFSFWRTIYTYGALLVPVILSAFPTGTHTDSIVNQRNPGGKSPDPYQKVVQLMRASARPKRCTEGQDGNMPSRVAGRVIVTAQ